MNGLSLPPLPPPLPEISVERREPVAITPMEVIRLRQKFPTHVFALVRKGPKAVGIPTIDKNKYIVPATLTFGEFMFIIRKRIRLGPEKALFLFVGNTIPVASQTMGEVNQHYARNGYLEVFYTGESVFGTSCQKGHSIICRPKAPNAESVFGTPYRKGYTAVEPNGSTALSVFGAEAPLQQG